MNRHARDNEDSKTTLLGCRHSSVIKELMKQFANNFSLLVSKKKKGWKCKAPHKEEILKNGVLLIFLNNKEAKDATSLREEDKDEMLVITERDIQEFKDTWTMYWMCSYSTLS